MSMNDTNISRENHHDIKVRNRLYESAAFYASRFKWQVFPVHGMDRGECTCRNKACNHKGKHPRTMNGVKDATTNQDLIYKWWKDWPNSNVGVATGKQSGFIVIDIDGGGEDSLQRLVDQYGELPDTVESITGSGGRHILLKYPDNFNGTIPNKVDWLPSVDIRGDNGYIVAPPSNHESGRSYEWEVLSRPTEVGIQHIPDWLLGQLTKAKEQQTPSRPNSYWSNLMQGISEGGRNQAAANLSGYLFRHYVDPHITIEIMRMWNERNEPPLNDDELQKVINSIAGKELARRKDKEGR